MVPGSRVARAARLLLARAGRWSTRYAAMGVAGMVDRSSRPQRLMRNVARLRCKSTARAGRDWREAGHAASAVHAGGSGADRTASATGQTHTAKTDWQGGGWWAIGLRARMMVVVQPCMRALPRADSVTSKRLNAPPSARVRWNHPDLPLACDARAGLPRV